MAQFWEAVRRGVCKVLFLGDSVTENVSQNYPMGHWTLEVQRELRRTFPWVTWSFVNLSIGGREARHVLGYRNGGAVPTTTLGAEYPSVTSSENNAINYLRAERTGHSAVLNPDTWASPASGESAWAAGQTWMSRLYAHDADLVTLCFGLNEENATGSALDPGGTSYFAQATQSIIDHIKSAAAWASYSRPSMVMLTPYNDTVTRGKRNRLAEQMRAIATANSIPLIDANRWDSILVEGVDPVRRRWFGEPFYRHLLAGKGDGTLLTTVTNDHWDITGTPTNSGAASAFISRTSTGAYALKLLRKRLARDVQITATFTSPSSGTATDAVCAAFYRVNPSNTAVGYEVKYEGAGTLTLFYHDGTTSHTVATKSIKAFSSNSEKFRLTVRCEGGLHQVWTAFGTSVPATGGDPSSSQLQISVIHTGAGAANPLDSTIFREGWAGFSIGSVGATYPVFFAGQFIQQTSVIEFGDPLPVAPSVLNGFDLNGYVRDWPGNDPPNDKNIDSPGGNTINHLVTDAYTMVYAAVVGDFVKQLAASRQDYQVLMARGDDVSVGATTSEEILATIPIPAGIMGKNGTVRVLTQWEMTNGANNKITRVRFGTTGTSSDIVMTNTLTTQNSARYLSETQNKNSEASQTSFQSGAISASGVSSLLTTVNTAVAQNMYICGLKGVAGDTLTLKRFVVTLVGG
jgi:hypothetical protein